MKIRADFVTNSSSVSYIISLHEDMIDFVKAKCKDYADSPRNSRIYKVLSKDILETGKKVELFDKEVFLKRYDIELKPDCKFDTSFDKPIDEVNFSDMPDKDLWSYIYGEYFVKGRLASELHGFGSLQVPKDVEMLRKKKNCVIQACNSCDYKDTEQCSKVIAQKRKEA